MFEVCEIFAVESGARFGFEVSGARMTGKEVKM